MILDSEKFNGPPESDVLVLIHGMGSAATAWKLIIPELTRHLTVITLDLPGHGKTPMSISQAMDPKSMADAVCETMSSLGIEKFHLCGNSLGGWVGLETAAKHSYRVLSFTGLAPAGLWLGTGAGVHRRQDAAHRPGQDPDWLRAAGHRFADCGFHHPVAAQLG